MASSNNNLVQRLQRLHVPVEESPTEDLSKYSLHQLQNMVVDFGNTHRGKSFATMWKDHQGWVKWFLQHYGSSSKASHRRIVHYFQLEIERCELEGGQIPLTDAPSNRQLPLAPSTKAKAKAQAKMQARPVEPRPVSPDLQLVLDPLTEEFNWEPVDHVATEDLENDLDPNYVGVTQEITNLSDRMNAIESLLSQVVGHLHNAPPSAEN